MANSAEVLMVDGALKRQGDSLAPQGVVMHCSRIAAMTINNTVDTVIGFDTRDFDPYGWLDTTNGRFTPKYPGYYRMSVNTLWTGVPSNSRWTSNFRKNGTSGVYTRIADISWGANGDGGFGGSDLIYFNGTTDYVEFIVWQNSGGARSILGGSPTYNFMSAELVGASAGIVPEPWHVVGSAGEPAFQNGWSGYNNGLAFCKMPDGTVRLKGEALAGTWTGGTPIFTLPVGYRPAWRHYFPAYMDSAPNVGVVCVQTNGEVQTEIRAGTATHIHGFGSVSFRAEQ